MLNILVKITNNVDCLELNLINLTNAIFCLLTLNSLTTVLTNLLNRKLMLLIVNSPKYLYNNFIIIERYKNKIIVELL